MSKYRIYEKDAYTPENWWMYACSSTMQAEFVAHKYINQELEKDHSSLEWKLATSVAEISDHYRFHEQNCTIYDPYAEMLAGYQTRTPIILFRGVSPVPFETMVREAKELGNPSIDFIERGFMSCSLLPEYALKFHGQKQLQIFVPPLTNVLYTGHLADDYNPFSYECIIQKDAHLEILRENDTYIYCLLKAHYKKETADY